MVMVCSQGRSDSQPANSLPAVLLIPTQNKALQTTKYIYTAVYIPFQVWSRMTWKAEFITAANNCPVLDGTKTQLSYFLACLAQIGDIGSIHPPTDFVGRRPQKPNTKTEVRPGLQLYDVFWRLVIGLLFVHRVFSRTKYMEYITRIRNTIIRILRK